jgi:hypothetical protein
MAISGKEAARAVIDALPDDASLDEILEAFVTLLGSDARSGGSGRPDAPNASPEETRDAPETPVHYHLEREGWATVLAPDRPVPPITMDLVNELIDEMRREREDRWFGLMSKDGE